MAEEDLNKQILTQVEYYMSDVNLKRDSFFQKEMAKNDGFIGVDVLLKCNKLKKLTTDADLVMKALEASTELVIGECKKKVKRKTPPPALDKDVAKRSKQKEAKKTDIDDEEALKKGIEERAAKACKDRRVFKIEGLPAEVKWTDIKDALKEQIDGKIFVQHEDGEKECHFSCMAEGNKDKFADTEEVKINDTTCKLSKMEDEAALTTYWVTNFTANIPKDLERDLNKKKHQKKGGKGNEGKKRKGGPQSGPVTIAGVTYPSKDEAKTKAMEMAKRSPDTELEVLSGADKDFAAALLEFHPKAAEKKTKGKDFAVGTNPEHPTTRCFFVVQEDGTKVDFSYIKCIDAAPEDGGKKEAESDAASPKAKKAKTESKSPTRSSPRLKAAQP